MDLVLPLPSLGTATRIRETRRRTVNFAIDTVTRAPRDELRNTTNSYFGLLRQASHSQRDRARLARAVLGRGCAVNHSLTKTFRSQETA
jgi:RNA-directed DNA polymerase